MLKQFPFPALVMIAALSATGSEPGNVTVLRTPDNGIQPQAATDAQGTVHLIYLKGEPRAGDIFYVRRQPGQKEFSKPIQVNTQPHTAMAMGTIRGAQLAVGKNGRVHVVWDAMGEGASNDSHPHHASDAPHSDAAHAPDTHTPHAPDAAQAHSRPAHHNSNGKTPLYYARLSDAGTAFEPERNVIT